MWIKLIEKKFSGKSNLMSKPTCAILCTASLPGLCTLRKSHFKLMKEGKNNNKRKS